MSPSSARWTRPAAITAAIFGLPTVVSGSLVLFGPEAALRAAGDTLPFVVIFYTAAGFAYLLGATALWMNHHYARTISPVIGLATLAVLAAFAVTALGGVAVERRTALALPIGAAFWLVVTWAAGRSGPPA